METLLTKDESFIVDEFIACLKEGCGEALKRIVFFGSRVKGTARPDSDFDFLIVLGKRDHAIIDKIYDYVVDFFLRYGADISLKIYKQEDYERFTAMPTPFFEEILKTGRVLWTR